MDKINPANFPYSLTTNNLIFQLLNFMRVYSSAFEDVLYNSNPIDIFRGLNAFTNPSINYIHNSTFIIKNLCFSLKPVIVGLIDVWSINLLH
jgi:hypothetical protein